MFHHWSQVQGSDIADGDAATVRASVERHLHDAASVGRLRVVAAELAQGIELSRYDDHQLVDLLTAALLGGGLRLGDPAQPMLYPLRPVVGRPARSAAPPRASGGRVAAPAPAPAAETTFATGLDVAAQVDSLRRAALGGVPFCEECARAAETTA